MKLDFGCSNGHEQIHRESNQDYEDNLACKETQSPNFNFSLKKSIYSNPLPSNPMKNMIHKASDSQENTTCKTHNSHSFNTPFSEVESQERPRLDKNLTFNFNTPINPNKRTKLMLGSTNSFDSKALNYEEAFDHTHTNKSNNTQNIIRDNKSNLTPPPLPLPPIDSNKNEESVNDDTESKQATKKKVCCNCKKSRCLKLYCDCFAAGEYCQDCNCTNCANIEVNSTERNNAILATLDRNPIAFKPKVDKIENQEEIEIIDKTRHVKGCNCKKSGCLKKYCECYQAGVKCSELCKCESCKNLDPSTLKKKAQTLNYLANMKSLNDPQNYRYDNSQGAEGAEEVGITRGTGGTRGEYAFSQIQDLEKSPKKFKDDYEYEQTIIENSGNNACKHRHSQGNSQIDEEIYNMMGANSSKKTKTLADNYNSYHTNIHCDLINNRKSNTINNRSEKMLNNGNLDNQYNQNEEKRPHNTRKDNTIIMDRVNFSSPFSKYSHENNRTRRQVGSFNNYTNANEGSSHEH